jgi:hypothetical protein
VPGELALRPEHVRHAFNEREPLAPEKRIRARLAIELHQLGLVVEGFKMRWRAREVDVYDAPGLGGMMRAWPFYVARFPGGVPGEQRVEGDAADARHAGLQEKAARLKLDGRAAEEFRGVHGIALIEKGMEENGPHPDPLPSDGRGNRNGHRLEVQTSKRFADQLTTILPLPSDGRGPG